MAFESLTDKLQNVFKNLRNKGRLTEADVKAALKEVKPSGLSSKISPFILPPSHYIIDVTYFLSSVFASCSVANSQPAALL